MKDYLVVDEQAEDGGWRAHSPDVEGVFARGEHAPEPHTDAGRVAA
jgi:predicted RNase H-like HicB family nuclease